MKINNGRNKYQNYTLEDGFCILRIHNDKKVKQEVFKDVDKSFIQLHFCLKNDAKLIFNEGRYALDLPENKSFLLYNPVHDLPIHLELSPNTKLVTLLISIEKFHTFFSQEAGLIHFLDDENRSKKYYIDKELNPNEIIVLNQLLDFGLHSSLEKLYTIGKIYELISLYFHKTDNDGAQSCPFLEDEANVEKIQMAKKILIDNMVDPLTLNELANRIKLPLQHLKDGFKHIYGETVFAFLLNYKMEYARKILATKKI